MRGSWGRRENELGAGSQAEKTATTRKVKLVCGFSEDTGKGDLGVAKLGRVFSMLGFQGWEPLAQVLLRREEERQVSQCLERSLE